MVLFTVNHITALSLPSFAVQPAKATAIQYKSYVLPQSIVHTLFIPAESQFLVTPTLSSKLDFLESFAQKHKAIAALNGGFFDPVNHKSTSYVVLQGKQVADPKQNERLINNPDLAPYLNKIFNRTELRRYLCGQNIRYDITQHDELVPKDCQLVDALGGGPGLLPDNTSVQEGFLDTANGKVIKDALGSNQANARTAVGITYDGSMIWVMVAQKPETSTTSGLSLPALANFMKTLGVEKAMNLDGGSSSAFYYRGKTLYGKVNAAGKQVKRPVKSVLLVQKNE